MVEGFELGPAVGVTEGTLDGGALGSGVGAPGRNVGTALGGTEGPALGLAEGNTLGTALGVTDGTDEGAALGTGVGLPGVYVGARWR
jgi:hypothetical protein